MKTENQIFESYLKKYQIRWHYFDYSKSEKDEIFRSQSYWMFKLNIRIEELKKEIKKPFIKLKTKLCQIYMSFQKK